MVIYNEQQEYEIIIINCKLIEYKHNFDKKIKIHQQFSL